MSDRKTVLITGAKGNLGSKMARHFSGQVPMRLLDIRPGTIKCGVNEAVICADVSQWNGKWQQHFQGIDTVFHFAANPSPRSAWRDTLESNIDAVTNVFEAAARANVRRVVFASSVWVMEGYRDDHQVKSIRADMPPRPWTRVRRRLFQRREINPYAVTKLLGERLGKFYAEARGLSVVAVRLGHVLRGPNLAVEMRNRLKPWGQYKWLSNRDFCQLMQRCLSIELADPFTLINGFSANKGMLWDISATSELLGYQPVDDVLRAA